MPRKILKDPFTQSRSISVTFKPETITKLNDLCFDLGISRSQFMQELVTSSLDRREKAKNRKPRKSSKLGK